MPAKVSPPAAVATTRGATLPLALLTLSNARMRVLSATKRRSFGASRAKSLTPRAPAVSSVLPPMIVRSTTPVPAEGLELGDEPIAAWPLSPTKILLAPAPTGMIGASPPPPPAAGGKTGDKQHGEPAARAMDDGHVFSLRSKLFER